MGLAQPKRLGGGTISPSHARSRIQEKKTAQRLGGKVTVGSGNKHEKGDVRVKGLTRIEAKTTKNKSFSITKGMIEKIELACFGADEVPIMEIEVDNGSPKPCSVYVIPKWALDDLLEAAKRGQTNAA